MSGDEAGAVNGAVESGERAAAEASAPWRRENRRRGRAEENRSDRDRDGAADTVRRCLAGFGSVAADDDVLPGCRTRTVRGRPP